MDFDSTNQYPHTDRAATRLEAIHDVYRDMLKAAVASCKKNGVLFSKDDLETIMESVGESLVHEADDALTTLSDAGFTDFSYTPADKAQLIAAAAEEIVNAFRPKKLDVAAAFNQIFGGGHVAA